MHGTVLPNRRAIARRDDSWTYRETEALREHWPDMGALRRCLPHRSEKAITYMAHRCGVIPPKDQHIWTAAEDKRLKAMALSGLTRKQMATAFGLSVTQVQNRLQYTKTNITRQPPAPCKDALAHAVRQRAFEMRMTVRDLDRSLGNQRIFQQAPHKDRVLVKHIDRAVKALGGRLTIVWDELE